MITTNTTGASLSATFNSRIQASFQDDTQSPSDEVLFCRKVSGTWYNRNVTPLWVGMGDIEKGMADQPGVSEGTEVNFSFSNAPITVLRAAYNGGTELWVEDRTFGQVFTLAVGDWICVSDFDNSEVRRITEVYPTIIRISRGLFKTYKAGAQIRFFFAAHPTKDILGPTDAYSGWLLVKAGYDDATLTEHIYSYMGRLNAGQSLPDDTVVLTAQDRVQELVEYEFADDIEFDDRGVATVPKPNSTNTGDGEIESVRYHSGKLPDKLTTETWTLTYVNAHQVYSGVTYDTSGWTLSGSVSGTIDSGDDLPNGDPTTRFLPTGNIEAGEVGERTWVIDDALTDIGWGTTIREGRKQFADGDTFRLMTQASGVVAAVNGGDYTTNKIDTVNLADLRVSSVVDYLFTDKIPLTHENPETATVTALWNNKSDVAARGQDQYSWIRGRFEKGTKAILVIDHALKTIQGWMTTSADDHIRVYIDSPFILNSPTNLTLSADVDNPDRTRNVLEVQPEPLAIERVKNRVTFAYDTNDTNKEYTTPDSEASDSQSEFGIKPLVIRTESLDEISLSTRFLANRTSIRSTANRILRKLKYPRRRFTLLCHPNTLLLELGDTPWLYARNVQFSGRRIWVTRFRQNLFTRVIQIEAQDAQHLRGKWFKFADGATPSIASRWSEDGFIGSVGDERFLIIGKETLQLDGIGNNDGDYDAELGTPDQWDNFVEDNFKIW